MESVWRNSKEERNFFVIVVYVGEQEGEHLAGVCFEEGIEEESEKKEKIVAKVERQKEGASIEEKNDVAAIDGCPLEDLKAFKMKLQLRVEVKKISQ